MPQHRDRAVPSPPLATAPPATAPRRSVAYRGDCSPISYGHGPKNAASAPQCTPTRSQQDPMPDHSLLPQQRRRPISPPPRAGHSTPSSQESRRPLLVPPPRLRRPGTPAPTWSNVPSNHPFIGVEGGRARLNVPPGSRSYNDPMTTAPRQKSALLKSPCSCPDQLLLTQELPSGAS